MDEALYRRNLIATGLVTEKMLDLAQRERIDDEHIDKALGRLGLADPSKVYSVMAKQLGVPLADLSRFTPSPLARRLIPDWVCIREGVMPLKCDASTVKLGMICPNDLHAIENASFAADRHVVPILCPREQLLDLQARLFDPESNQERSPAVKLINKILRDAFLQGSSDIHIEPQSNATVVRMRVDGELQELTQVSGSLSASIVGRVKIMANLDIAKRYEPQDGSFSAKLGNRRFDVRVSTIPVPGSEKIVMRLLDPETSNVELKDLGVLPDIERDLRRLLALPQGLLIVTGPTGSGKSTTLCSILNALKEGNRSNLVSIENPIEYQISGVNQIQINPRQNMTFASALRSILRQDPDVISVGEIRDGETALIAHHAAETGHLVFSTLHTNDAPTAISRLFDLGVEPFVVSSALTAVLAQRLLRRVCRKCGKRVQPTEEELAMLASYKLDKTATLVRAKGCRHCSGTGYRGRIAANELLEVDLQLRNMIAAGSTAEAIYEAARKAGFRTMWEAGLILASRGITTLEEVKKRVPPSPDTGTRHVPHEDSEPRASQPSIQSKRLCILIADDDPSIRKMVAHTLKPLQADIVTADNGKDAVRLAFSKKPTLVVTDLDMPGMNGFEVTNAIRGNVTTAAIPIIILTANDTEQAEISGMDCGADDFLTKPFAPLAMLARVKAVIRRTQLNRGITGTDNGPHCAQDPTETM